MKSLSRIAILLLLVAQGASGADLAQADPCAVAATADIRTLDPLIGKCVEPLPRGATALLFTGLGDWSHPIAVRGTNADKAQQYFDQGLKFWYAFNMPESLLSFAQAAKFQPEAPMPYWGLALAGGPDFNHKSTCACLHLCYRASRIAVHKAIAQALKTGVTADATSQLEDAIRKRKHDAAQAVLDKHKGKAEARRALLELCYAVTMAQRYGCEAKGCPKCGLDATYRCEAAHALAFSQGLEFCHRLIPEDQDLASLNAFALMQLHPWQWWTVDKKEPTPEITRALLALRSVLDVNDKHPGAHHLHIHAVEQGPQTVVEKGLDSARKLPELMPAAGHFHHMPSHIYLNFGQYDRATAANVKAVAVDREYLKLVARSHPVARYPLHYLGHNLHFLTRSQTAQGHRANAMATARELLDNVIEYSRGYNAEHNQYLVRAKADLFLVVPLTTSIQFDFFEWDDTRKRVAAGITEVGEILKKAKADNADLWYSHAMLAYGDTLHAIGKQQWEKGIRRAGEYRKRKGAELEVGNNRASAFLEIADQVLIARTAQAAIQDPMAREALPKLLATLGSSMGKDTPPGKLAIQAWQKAVTLQDKLNYNDPSDWYAPNRQSLGAAHYLQGQLAEAEDVFRQDLKNIPGNPRSTYGLIQTLKKREKAVPAELERHFQTMWGKNPLPSMESL